MENEIFGGNKKNTWETTITTTDRRLIGTNMELCLLSINVY